MNGTSTFDYAGLETALQAAEADCGAAESHGLLCGISSATDRVDTALWLEQILGEGNNLSVTTLPLLCPFSTYLWASAISSNR